MLEPEAAILKMAINVGYFHFIQLKAIPEPPAIALHTAKRLPAAI